MPIRVVVGDESYLAREGITGAFAGSDSIDLVATCTDLDGLRNAIEESCPDVVLTDIRMPPDHTDEGIRLAADLRKTHPHIGVVVLSQDADPAYAIALFEHGAARRAYLLKERLKDRAELARIVQEVADGGSHVDPHIVEALVSERRRRHDSRLDRLTQREREILDLIAAGRSNSAIADELVIAKRSVERHINAIFEKLELGGSEDVSRRVKAALAYLADDGT